MRNRKRLFFIVLIILFLPGISAIYLQVKISYIKFIATERFEKNQLQTLEIPLTDVQWSQVGKELIIGQRLFDVKEYCCDNTVLIATGLFDDLESGVKSELTNLWQQQKSEHDIFLLHYFQILGNACFEYPYHEKNNITIVSKTYHSDINYSLRNIYLKIPYPPPQI